MRKFLFAVGLSMLAFASPAMAQNAAEKAAATLQGLVGTEYEGDLQFTSVRAEGNVLVLTLNGRSGWFDMKPEDIATVFVDGFCKNPNATAFFNSGAKVRVDTLDHGKDPKRGNEISACPPAAK